MGNKDTHAGKDNKTNHAHCARRQIQQSTTTNCVMHLIGANFTLCTVASYDRRRRQALSLAEEFKQLRRTLRASGAIFYLRFSETRRICLDFVPRRENFSDGTCDASANLHSSKLNFS